MASPQQNYPNDPRRDPNNLRPRAVEDAPRTRRGAGWFWLWIVLFVAAIIWFAGWGWGGYGGWWWGRTGIRNTQQLNRPANGGAINGGANGANGTTAAPGGTTGNAHGTTGTTGATGTTGTAGNAGGQTGTAPATSGSAPR